MKLKQALLTCVGILIVLVGLSYYYVFIAGSPQLDPPKIEAYTGLTFQQASLNSKAMGAVRRYGVILPPDYSRHPKQQYPVIFLLHGGHDNYHAYYDKYAVTSVLYQLYTAGKLPPTIVIMPDGNDNRGSSPLWDPQYYDGANGNLGTLIGSELVQVVKSSYRTLPNPQFWAMGGVSSGGWGAFNIGLRYLNNFNILFSHSGYFTDNSGVANSPQAFVQKLQPQERKRLRIYLDAGQSDTDLLASTRQFHQVLNKLKISNIFFAFPGGHGLSGADFGWNYFHKHLADSLSYVGKQLQQAELTLNQ